jgi:hypothetical protein
MMSGRQKEQMRVRNQLNESTRTRMKIRWSHVCLFLAGMILVLVGRIVVDHYRAVTVANGPSLRRESEATGPWGVMEKQTVMLDRPAGAFPQSKPPREIAWLFGHASRAELRTLIPSFGLPAAQQATLLDESRWHDFEHGILVVPPLELVRNLAPATRARLYDALGRTDENQSVRFPFVFRGPVEEWLDGCPLSQELRQTVADMVYKNGDVSVFADMPYLRITFPSNEVLTLTYHLSRVPAVIARLELDDRSDLAALKKYWLPGKDADFGPLLSSLARVPGGTTLGVETLLPPLPRLLLYSYPQERPDFPPQANCVWSSMNFFNTQPDHRFMDEQFTFQTLRSQYQVVPRADAFGDVIMLYTPGPEGQMKLVHLCVHIAEDIVFTKNGLDVNQPWALMRLADVQALFPAGVGQAAMVFRRHPST